MAGGKASAKKVSIAQRQLMALEMRKSGASYRVIGESIRQYLEQETAKKSKYDYRQAHKDVAAALAEVTGRMLESAEDVLVTELLRLDEMLSAVWDKALAGDGEAVRLVLQLMEHRARLMGLNQVNVIHMLFSNRPSPAYTIDDRMNDDDLDKLIGNLLLLTQIRGRQSLPLPHVIDGDNAP